VLSLDIRPLRVLDSIMSTGSVTDAAHMMRRTQPQISRILRTLEGDLGFELFERHGRRMVPTARGRAFHAHARKLLDEAEALSRVAETVRMTREQTLRVAAPA
jgi:DNA-binding transcriptional LysR family regulator